MWMWMFHVALGLELEASNGPVDLPRWVRVEDPAAVGALARSHRASVLEEPPAGDVAWRWEPLPVVDGFPAEAALDALNADHWHEAGWYGQGVRVAVFDIQWFGAASDPTVLGEVETADCWAHSSCEAPLETREARFGYETGVHGYACAEIIRDVAPEAELTLVRVNGLTTFENAVRWAIREDIDIISMSMSFFNSSFYDGTGPFGELMDELAAAGVLMVTSSGNYAREHWAGAWRDVDGDGWMDFGGEPGLRLDMSSGARRTVYVSWDEHGRCGHSDLDVYLVDALGNVVGRSEDVQEVDAKRCEPVERVTGYISETGPHWLQVRANRVVAPNLSLDVFTLNGTIAEPTPAFSIADPGAHPAAFTVGAVRAQGYLNNDIQGFSSQGPVRSGVAKPNIAGPDGLTSTAYGAESFFGTSAATPAVAGALALVMSREPELSSYEAASRLQGWALNDDPQGRRDDPRWGAGKARLPKLDLSRVGCGRGQLLASLWWLPFFWRRRRLADG